MVFRCFQQAKKKLYGWMRKRPDRMPARVRSGYRGNFTHEMPDEWLFYPKIMKYAEFNGLQGDYVEFGVYKGASFISSYNAAARLRLPQMRFFAFDSFQGLPSSADPPFRAGAFAAPVETFEKALRRARVNLRKVVIIPGWFDVTLSPAVKTEYDLERAAVAWIDCDLYESTVPVLEFLVDILEDGAILVFRDWYCHRGNRNQGEQRAVKEWLARYPDIALVPYRPVSWNGEAFLFYRSGPGEADPRRLQL